MRKAVLAAAGLVILAAVSWTAAPAQAMAISAPAALKGASDNIKLTEPVCWNCGWGPGYGYYRPYRPYWGGLPATTLPGRGFTPATTVYYWVLTGGPDPAQRGRCASTSRAPVSSRTARAFGRSGRVARDAYAARSFFTSASSCTLASRASANHSRASSRSCSGVESAEAFGLVGSSAITAATLQRRG